MKVTDVAKKKVKGKIVAVLGSILPEILMVIVVAALLGGVLAFFEWFVGIISGPTAAEKLYSWAVTSMVTDGELLSIEEIENMPYKASAITQAFKLETDSTDFRTYVIKVQTSEGEYYTAQYNLKQITANYAIPWQLMLAICTANQYGDLDEFMEMQQIALEDPQMDGFTYYVTDRSINAVYDRLHTDIEYITNYSLYGLADDDSGNSYVGINGDGPSYDEYERLAVTDISDTEGKLACVYRENDEGVGVYYPVAALKHVRTWLWDYDFYYDIDLDDSGRPISYHLVNVKKSSRISGDDGLLANLRILGIEGDDMIELLYYIIDEMPYASENGISEGMMEAVNYYQVTGAELVETIIDYDESLTFNSVDARLLDSWDMDKIIRGYEEQHMVFGLDKNKEWPIEVDRESLWTRTDAVRFASEFVGGIYYMVPMQYEDGYMDGRISSYDPFGWSWESGYPEMGTIITDEEDALREQQFGYYNTGYVYGLTDWDFVRMVLSETLYFDASYSGLLAEDELRSASDSAFVAFYRQFYSEGMAGGERNKIMFQTAGSLYEFAKWCHASGNTDVCSIINYNNEGLSIAEDIERSLIYGDLGLNIDDDGNVTAIGIYAGCVNGYPSFIHCAPSAASCAVIYQGSVQLSYLESAADGAMHPDGGTVDYNCFIRLDKGSYDVSDGSGLTYYTDTQVWIDALKQEDNLAYEGKQ